MSTKKHGKDKYDRKKLIKAIKDGSLKQCEICHERFHTYYDHKICSDCESRLRIDIEDAIQANQPEDFDELKEVF